MLRSSTARFFALVFLVQLVLGTSLLLLVRHKIAGELERQSRDLVETLRDDLLAGYAQGGQEALRRLIAARIGGTRGSDTAVLLQSPDGARLAGNVAGWPPTLPNEGGLRQLSLYRLDRAEPERVSMIDTRLPDGSHLLAGHVVEADFRLRALLGETMLAAALLAIPLALLGAIVATRVVTARVARIADTARRVGQGELSLRVPADEDARDVFTRLSRSINDMLVRIEALVTELRVVTDALAHDLRSPLTRLRATIDRAMRETGDEAALAALERAGGEAEALLAMLSTALEISRAEAGIGRDRFVEIDIGAMLADLAEMYGPLAEERGLALAVDGSGHALVHRELLGQAIANLVDNAIKYGAAGGVIRLSATEAGGGLRIAVDDDGPGIPAGDHAEALRRFGRLDPARSEAGAGLGLALVAAVARLHDGRFELGDNDPGLSASLSLPRR